MQIVKIKNLGSQTLENDRKNLFMQTSFGLVAKKGQIRFIAMSLQKLLNDAVFFPARHRF